MFSIGKPARIMQLTVAIVLKSAAPILEGRTFPLRHKMWTCVRCNWFCATAWGHCSFIPGLRTRDSAQASQQQCCTSRVTQHLLGLSWVFTLTGAPCWNATIAHRDNICCVSCFAFPNSQTNMPKCFIPMSPLSLAIVPHEFATV
jgi:hypothetical protein